MEEVRNKVYDWTLELINEGKVLQGIILMLSTWNFATFRYHMRTFNLTHFEETIKKCDFILFNSFSFDAILILFLKTKNIRTETAKINPRNAK